jgi:glycosyltransferase Alg8
MEDSGKHPFTTSVKKMHRWFGNMLRNNGRAIRLGLGRQKPFIWWCQIDQRISIFTSLIGPIAALWSAVWISPYILYVYGIHVIITRLFYSLVLVLEGHRMSFVDLPLLLYTQWGGSLVKVYTMFHLHRQKWDSHRQSSSGQKSRESFFDRIIPKLQIALCFTLLISAIAMFIGV